MKNLAKLLKENEAFLMKRILKYAKINSYTKYTSTLEEAWRLSISGLSQSIIEALENSDKIPELSPDEEFISDPVAQFGKIEARRHRERGISLTMFLGLYKYYQQTYQDLIKETNLPEETELEWIRVINRCFDRIEIAFCAEWSDRSKDDLIFELQDTNRNMTNQKNAYLTVFESLTHPVILLDSNGDVRNLNHAAARLTNPDAIPGGFYYYPISDEKVEKARAKEKNTEFFDHIRGKKLNELFPWLEHLMQDINSSNYSKSRRVDCHYNRVDETKYYEAMISHMLDVSGKFIGSLLVLYDLTDRKKAEEERTKLLLDLQDSLKEVHELKGLLPICSHCKKIRDDQGYWSQIESFLHKHTDAELSHSVCPECAGKYYPEFYDKKDNT